VVLHLLFDGCLGVGFFMSLGHCCHRNIAFMIFLSRVGVFLEVAIFLSSKGRLLDRVFVVSGKAYYAAHNHIRIFSYIFTGIFALCLVLGFGIVVNLHQRSL